MKKFILGFSKSKSPWKIGSKVIRAVEKRDFSHAYIKYECPTTEISIIAQASHGYVNETCFDIFKIQNVVCEEYAIVCTDEQFIAILKFIKCNLGVDYSQAQLLFIAIKKLFGAQLDINDKDKSFICSEFAARICQISGAQVSGNLDYYTPSDLNSLIKKLGYKNELV